MRCLQCGKSIPMLKRLSSSEFCSEAHRRQYEQEYSQLALGRLMQSKPPQATADRPNVSRNISLPTTSAAAKPTAAVLNGNSVDVKKGLPDAANVPPPAMVETLSNTVSPAPDPPLPAGDSASDPPVAKALVEKPGAQAFKLSRSSVEVAHPFSSQAPRRLLRRSPMPTGGLSQAESVNFEADIEIVDLPATIRRQELELRSPQRATPKIGVELSVAAPLLLTAQNESLSIPLPSGSAPPEGVLATAPQRAFEFSLSALGDFANILSTTGLEAPQASTTALDGVAPDESTTAEASEPGISPSWREGAQEPLEVAAESSLGEQAPPQRPAAPSATADGSLIPNPVLERLPISVQAIATGEAAELLVFPPIAFDAPRIGAPQTRALPLRPLMVLAAASPGGPASSANVRKPDVRVLPPITEPKLPSAAIETPRTAAPQQAAEDARADPPVTTPSGQSPVVKLSAIAGGIVVMSIVGFLLLNSHSGSGSNTRPQAGAPAEQWITDIVADSKNQRTLTVLRSSMELPSYRIEFESSIQIKGLGWVYRAQDAKNFYVSKIELDKAGLNPQYVLAHYAVIDGVDQPRSQSPLKTAMPLGAPYKIRFEAVEDHFTTWVQDQKVDEWTDGRLKRGGAGLYNEGAERSTMHGDFRITPLPIKK